MPTDGTRRSFWNGNGRERICWEDKTKGAWRRPGAIDSRPKRLCCFHNFESTFRMDLLVFAAVLFAAAAIDGAQGNVMVSGTVFCDQCKDGQVSLFDFPLFGMRVSMACPSRDGQYTMWKEGTTNWLGNYVMRFNGAPNLSECFVQVSGSRRGSGSCSMGAGPAKQLRLVFHMFDMQIYTVDPLIAQPAEPMSYCSRSAAPVTPIRPPPFRVPTLPPIRAPWPPLPRLPPMPPAPFLQYSACPYQKWMMPEFKCHWRVVNEDTKVAVAFGVIAARRYGTDLNLREALNGRGEPYRTLLREGTAALLNSYSSIQFPFHPIGIIQNMNLALVGPTQLVLRTAMSFMRANSGARTNASCRLTPCK